MPSLLFGHVTGSYSAATVRICPCQLPQLPFPCLIFFIAYSSPLFSHPIFVKLLLSAFHAKIINPCFKSCRPREEEKLIRVSKWVDPDFPSPSLSSLYKSDQQSECQNTQSTRIQPIF